MTNSRTATFPINEIFLNRQSAYAFSGESITQDQLMALFEAAHWAPSSYNNQPTRFIYAHRNTPQWQPLFNLMAPANQAWTKDTAVLVVIISKKTMPNGTPSITNSFEAGAAWMSLALQATMNGLSAHGMSGFDYEKARTDLNIPDEFKIEMMCAIGKQAMPSQEKNIDQKYCDRDANPTLRKSINEIAAHGTYSFTKET